MGNKAPKWNYADSNGKEIELNSEANSVLEGAYSAGTTHYHSLSFPIGGKHYSTKSYEWKVDFKTMTVTNVESGTVRKISRLPDALPLCLRNKTVKEDDLPPPSEKEEERMDDFNQKIVIRSRYTTAESKDIFVCQGNIVHCNTETIVNAANGKLLHIGGIAAAIRIAAGPEFMRESREYVKKNGEIPAGGVGVTGAGNIPTCKNIIHAVGPMWNEYSWFHRRKHLVDCCWQLHNCVAKSLEAADSLKVQSITIPSISTGIFGGEIDLCSKLIVYSIAEYFQENPASSVKEVVLLSWDEERLISFDVQANSVWKKEAVSPEKKFYVENKKKAMEGKKEISEFQSVEEKKEKKDEKDGKQEQEKRKKSEIEEKIKDKKEEKERKQKRKTSIEELRNQDHH